MRPADWVVLALALLSIIGFGLYKGRGSKTMAGYLLADRQMRWYVVALSIMATQASAITFTSTPGQAFVDGMRFVQFYFGLPIAMVLLSVTVVPLFHSLKVYTAYEYLEQRFDAKTRTITSLIFLLSRGLGAGMSIYASSVILSVMLGIDIMITSGIIGGAIIVYTTSGGVKAVNWTDLQQMLIIMGGMVLAFVMAIKLLPDDVSFTDALAVAGGMGKLNLIDFSFDLGNRYNFWSGIIGGTFVALAYFGTDQSQVQRYLTGQSVTQSRLGLLFNGIAKVPMQFFILLIGVMVFVVFQFIPSPLIFNPVETARIKSGQHAQSFGALEVRHAQVSEEKAEAIRQYLIARKNSDPASLAVSKQKLEAIQHRAAEVRGAAVALMEQAGADAHDTNYIFLSFVMRMLPAGVVGLIFACIFAASMSSSSGELSALATASIVDIYKRHVRTDAGEQHYVLISRWAMAGWGIYGILFAQFASGLGSLVEAVNILGSLFYGTMLGVFLLALLFKHVGGTAAFWAAAASQTAVLGVFIAERLGILGVAWLWYPVLGCGMVLGTGLVLQFFVRSR